MGKHNNHNTKNRALACIAAGIILTAVGAVVIVIGLKNGTQKTTGSIAYQYTVNQSVQADVQYFDSSYYANHKPSPENNAYVADLTDTIQGKFHYAFSANLPAELTITYSVQAQVQSNYALKGNTEAANNVWQKTYQLTQPVVSQKTGTDITLDPSVTIPYTEYKKAVQDFRASLSLPTTGKLVVLMIVQVSGAVNGTPFTDARTSSISVPLDEQVYQPIMKFDDPDTKKLTPKENQPDNSWVIVGMLAAVSGLALGAYGVRQRTQKSAYRRELEKIYHYHNGIIVRTSRPITISGRQVIPMHSFNDMLNLEEELKTPIIADEISDTTTHFIVAHDNVLYRYVLGDKSDQPVAAGASETPQAEKPSAETPPTVRSKRSSDGIILKKHPLGEHSPTPPTQQPAPLNDDLTEIIKELSKESTGKSKRS